MRFVLDGTRAAIVILFCVVSPVSILVCVFVMDLYYFDRPWKDNLMTNPLSISLLLTHEIPKYSGDPLFLQIQITWV